MVEKINYQNHLEMTTLKKHYKIYFKNILQL